MRSRIKVARLAAWIRLVPDEDGYGIPLFQARGNARLTAETDDDLVITAFNEFYNEASYAISTTIPTSQRKEGLKYRVGDKVPIPLSIAQGVKMVDAGQSADAFLSEHGASQRHPTVQAVAGILRSSATGAYRAATMRRIVTQLRLEHDEILSGEPAHSAYWVQKLGQTAAAVKRMPKADQLPGRGIVAERAMAWLQKFSSKSDTQMLGRLLKVAAEGGGVNNAEIKAVVFSITLSRFVEGTLRGKEAERVLALTRPWLPAGLYGYYLQHGVPEGLRHRDREKARDLPRLLMEVLADDEDGQTSLGRSLALSGAIFADSDLPVEISDAIGRMALNRAETLKTSMNWAFSLQGAGNRRPAPDDAARILLLNDTVVSVYRILHGEDRLSYDPRNARLRYGLTDRDIEWLREAAKPRDASQGAAPSSQLPKKRKHIR